MRLFLGLVLCLVFALADEDESTTPQDSSEDADVDAKSGGHNCKCVPNYQCQDGVANTDGSGLLDPRKNPPSSVDIPLNSQVQPPYCGAIPGKQYNTYVCCKNPSDGTTNPNNPYKDRCGIRNANGVDSRIMAAGQDNSVAFGEFPWQAAVLKREGSNDLFICGAVLIDKTHCLTAAHNVAEYKSDPSNLRVRFGVWDAQSKKEPLPQQTIGVEKIIMHSGYDKENLHNDLAIIELVKSVTYAPNVDRICLPKEGEHHYGQECIVTGWGKNAFDQGQFSRYLKKAQVPVLKRDQCQKKLRETRLGPFYELDPGFLCAGGKRGQDSCKGDGGGPLACYRSDGTYCASGIVSWGIGCGTEGVPGVYVNVAHYVKWISKNTGHPVQHYWPKD